MSDLRNKRYRDGSIINSSDDWEESHYNDYSLFYPVLGVVLEVYPPDHPKNKSSRDDTAQRGYYWEADVMVLNAGTEGQTTLPHVVIAAPGPTGVDNFTQGIPRPSRFLLDGSEYRTSMSDVNPNELDGDRCLVQFIGGKYNQPVMTSWMPHPSNRVDPSTEGIAPGTLNQGTPHLHRRNGTTLTITDEGSLYIDTNGANSQVSGSTNRTNRVGGGDIQLDIKDGKRFEVNFNPVVIGSNEPSLPQPNPQTTEPDITERSEDKTSLYMDQDYIVAIAGEVVKIISNNNDIVLSPFGNLFFGGTQSTENMVLGQLWKTMMTTLMSAIQDLMDAVINHTHTTGTGPSGPSLPPQSTDVVQLVSDVQQLVDSIDDILSDYIFGSKVPPDEELDEREIETGETA